MPAKRSRLSGVPSGAAAAPAAGARQGQPHDPAPPTLDGGSGGGRRNPPNDTDGSPTTRTVLDGVIAKQRYETNATRQCDSPRPAGGGSSKPPSRGRATPNGWRRGGGDRNPRPTTAEIARRPRRDPEGFATTARRGGAGVSPAKRSGLDAGGFRQRRPRSVGVRGCPPRSEAALTLEASDSAGREAWPRGLSGVVVGVCGGRNINRSMSNYFRRGFVDLSSILRPRARYPRRRARRIAFVFRGFGGIVV